MSETNEEKQSRAGTHRVLGWAAALVLFAAAFVVERQYGIPVKASGAVVLFAIVIVALPFELRQRSRRRQENSPGVSA